MEIMKFKLKTLKEFLDQPAPSYIVKDVFVDHSISLLQSFVSRKTLLKFLLSVAKSVITGSPLWGKFQVLRTGPVLIVDEEVPMSFYSNFTKVLGFDETSPLFLLHRQGIDLNDSGHFESFLEVVEKVKPVLVVLKSSVSRGGSRSDGAGAVAFSSNIIEKNDSKPMVILVYEHGFEKESFDWRSNQVFDCYCGVDVGYLLLPFRGNYILRPARNELMPLRSVTLEVDFNGKTIFSAV